MPRGPIDNQFLFLSAADRNSNLARDSFKLENFTAATWDAHASRYNGGSIEGLYQTPQYRTAEGFGPDQMRNTGII